MAETPVTADEYQGLIATAFGLSDDDEFLDYVEKQWRVAAEAYPAATSRLYMRYLYTRREVLNGLLAGGWQSYDWKDSDVSEDEGGVFAALLKLKDGFDADIAAFLAQGRSGAVLGGQLTTTTAIPPVCGLPNPSDPAYKGDPQRRWFGRIARRGNCERRWP